jgi:rhodanese-related sulfurtransferase
MALMDASRRISPTLAKRKMDEGYTYIDVREPDEFAEGHPAKSINIPFRPAANDGASASSNPFVREFTARFPKDARLILGCTKGIQSHRAAELLVHAGFTDVYDQRAGFDAARGPFGEVVEPGWRREGLPIETGATAGGGGPNPALPVGGGGSDSSPGKEDC